MPSAIACEKRQANFFDPLKAVLFIAAAAGATLSTATTNAVRYIYGPLQ